MPIKVFCAIFAVLLFFTDNALAHFGIVIPSRSTAMSQPDADITAIIAFSHPFSGLGMNMEKPKSIFLAGPSGKSELRDRIEPVKFMDHDAWRASFRLTKPGVWQLAAIPEPYYEKSEDKFIIHYTKTIMAAFGGEDDWSRTLGLPMEIAPLIRPFANYAGNLFGGTVLKDGKPLPNAPVEIEFLNTKGKIAAPNPYFETQLLRTDQNGNFFFAVPWAGWWGFAALSETSEKIEKDSTPKDVEIGGVLWLEFSEPLIKK